MQESGVVTQRGGIGKGRGAIDSVMLMAMLMEKHPEGELIGRDAQSIFNTLRRDRMAEIT